MSSRALLLRIDNDRIWFNSTDFVEIGMSDIPYTYLTFRTKGSIYWKVNMQEYNAETQELSVEIEDYTANDLPAFLKQKPKKPVGSIVFGSFDWRYLEPQLSSYQQVKFAERLTHADEAPHEPEPTFGQHPRARSSVASAKNKPTIETQTTETGEAVRVLQFQEKFAIPFSESTFMLGYVACSKYIGRLGQTIDFKISNDHVLPEFDAIKFWFAKVLKTRKMNVKAYFTLHNGELHEYHAISRDIDQIDKNLIEGVKTQRTLQITTTMRPLDIDQALFTSDDLYGLDDSNDLEGNVFGQSEKDILDLLIDNGKVRNRKELIYLSGAKQSSLYRIRFTNHPYFGFIFLAEGEMNHHFIWELLNSHATYIWTIEKDHRAVEMQYKRIENTLNTVLDCGRDKYKRAYTRNNQDDDLIFNVIHHQDKGSELIDEFPKWKHKVNALIT